MKIVSLKYDITQRALGNQQHPNTTARAIRTGCRRFAKWCTENDLNKIAKIERKGPVNVIQDYTDYLVERGYSASTIHTYIFPVCRASQVGMNEIKKPARTCTTITRSRDPSKNARGKADLENPKYRRLVEFQRAVGIRRAELARLKGCDLVKDETNGICVRVLKGKGGKGHLQRVLPDDIDIVLRTFAGIKGDQNVFSSAEMRNNIDLHGLRAEHARKAYDYYCNMSAEEKKTLIYEMSARWLACHQGCRTDSPEFKKWYTQLWKNHGFYDLRGENYQRAVDAGCPTRYSRVELMAVSIFHLSHWRLDVTVKNYML